MLTRQEINIINSKPDVNREIHISSTLRIAAGAR
jgi:hypothetical protein